MLRASSVGDIPDPALRTGRSQSSDRTPSRNAEVRPAQSAADHISAAAPFDYALTAQTMLEIAEQRLRSTEEHVNKHCTLLMQTMSGSSMRGQLEHEFSKLQTLYEREVEVYIEAKRFAHSVTPRPPAAPRYSRAQISQAIAHYHELLEQRKIASAQPSASSGPSYRAYISRVERIEIEAEELKKDLLAIGVAPNEFTAR